MDAVSKRGLAVDGVPVRGSRVASSSLSVTLLSNVHGSVFRTRCVGWITVRFPERKNNTRRKTALCTNTLDNNPLSNYPLYILDSFNPYNPTPTSRFARDTSMQQEFKDHFGVRYDAQSKWCSFGWPVRTIIGLYVLIEHKRFILFGTPSCQEVCMVEQKQIQHGND